MAEEHHVMVVENDDFDDTIRIIMEDIARTVRKEISR
jgi:2-phosphoglycerate kinase